MAAASFDAFQRGQVSAFVSGSGIGTLAGLIGLGGAEFRLPFLISMFRLGALETVIINKAMSLVVVAIVPHRHDIPGRLSVIRATSATMRRARDSILVDIGLPCAPSHSFASANTGGPALPP